MDFEISQTRLYKVSLGDLFYARISDGREWRTYTNKIDRKHVDFLLCDRQTMHPLVGVELDDSSYRRSDRQARDAFVDWVFDAAGLPLHRVRVQRAYSLTKLRTLLGELAEYEELADEPPNDSPAPDQLEQPPVILPAPQPIATAQLPVASAT